MKGIDLVRPARTSEDLVIVGEGVVLSDGSCLLFVPEFGGAKIIYPSVNSVEAFASTERLTLRIYNMSLDESEVEDGPKHSEIHNGSKTVQDGPMNRQQRRQKARQNSGNGSR